MTLRIRNSEVFIHNIHTRIPFRFGITELTSVPHMFMKLDVEIDGVIQTGVSADTLIQKWFTKDPAAEMQDEIADLLRVIQHAADAGQAIGESESVFDLWMRLYDRQISWGAQQGYAPLLANFGTTIIERALIDAFCRAKNMTFWDALVDNNFEIVPGAIHPELEGTSIREMLPDQPLDKVHVRHTVGLTDPIWTEDIPVSQRVDDGLPQSLEENIDTYDLHYFKIKVNGSIDQDYDRLRRIVDLFDKKGIREYHYTLDGNEQYESVEMFQEFWEYITAQPDLSEFLDHLLYVEQPLKRGNALSESTGKALHHWPGHPDMIIDESDCCTGSFKEAVHLGYQGTSHKNCKGIFKSILNAGLIRHYRIKHPTDNYILSAEDLVNIGPIALLQDLAVVSALGIPHVERNGHQYFRGLDMFPQEIQVKVVSAHPDLYRSNLEYDFPTLNIQGGIISLASVNQSPFGYSQQFDPACCFTSQSVWNFDSLGIYE